MGCSAHVPAVPLPVADTAPREPSVADERIRGHLRALGMGDALDLFVDATFQRNTRWEVVTEPATSRLRQARTWREIVVTFADGSREALVEEHRYQFDWQAGQGRAPGCDGEPQEGAEAK